MAEAGEACEPRLQNLCGPKSLYVALSVHRSIECSFPEFHQTTFAGNSFFGSFREDAQSARKWGMSLEEWNTHLDEMHTNLIER